MLQVEDFKKIALYLINMESDIDSFELSNGFNIIRADENFFITMFGQKKVRKDNGWTYHQCGVGPYANSPRFHFDPDGLGVFENNYAFLIEDDNQAINYEKALAFDTALRLFRTGSSGFASGLTPYSYRHVHHQPNWKMLSPSKIMKSEIELVVSLSTKIKASDNSKLKLLIGRYRHATQGSNDVLPHSRIIDLLTILEMIYVPDGKSGEISFKLRTRVAKILAPILQKDAHEVYKLVKAFYELRSEIIHDTKNPNITREQWYDLVDIVRVSILEFLDKPNLFETDGLNKILIY